MTSVTRAILLVAGRGRRIGPLTDERPKCLLDVEGASVLERALSALAASGVREVALVVGYRWEQVREVAGDRFAAMNVYYVHNERHRDTNTAYSLWLARQFMSCDLLLVEGDILFDAETLIQILDCADGESVWGAVSVAPGRNEGILLERTDSDHVRRVELVRDPERRDSSLGFKCAGIQLLTTPLAETFRGKLEGVIGAGQRRLFGDLVLGEALKEHPMRLCSLDGARWAEVDDFEDLRAARCLFGASRRIAKAR